MDDLVIQSKVNLTMKIVLEVTDVEAQALIAMAGYGSKPFLKVFYENLGTSYMKPHEKGIVSLFEKISRQMPSHVSKLEKARQILTSKP